MLIGYTRVSTDDQDLALQRAVLKQAGCRRLHEEKLSGAKRDRPQLARLLDQAREGDVVVVSRLDRLARSTRDLLEIAEQLREAGAGLRSLGEPWADTTSPAGRMVLTVFAGIAEFERALIRECTGNGRAAALMAGLHVVAARTGLPLDLYELGASAGLNLMLDRYAYQLGSLQTGVEGSPVRLAPAWKGSPPPATMVHIRDRHGVDLHPLDVTKAADRERLLAYIWADQAERLARTEAAIAIAAADPPPLDRGDAAGWLEAQLDPAPRGGAVRVLMHSIVFQYFPPSTRQRTVAHLDRVGAAATEQAPLAWLSYEMQPAPSIQAALSLRLWPGGQEQILATGDPHARKLSWVMAEGARSAEAAS